MAAVSPVFGIRPCDLVRGPELSSGVVFSFSGVSEEFIIEILNFEMVTRECE